MLGFFAAIATLFGAFARSVRVADTHMQKWERTALEDNEVHETFADRRKALISREYEAQLLARETALGLPSTKPVKK